MNYKKGKRKTVKNLTNIPEKEFINFLVENFQYSPKWRLLFFKSSFQIVKNLLLFLLEILKKKIMLPMVERFFCNNDNSNTLTY